MKKQYIITNKKRFISFLALIFFIITMFITLLFSKFNKVYSSIYKEDYINVKISSGDTLWNVAINYMPKGYDVRKMIFEILEFNDMTDARIYPGDLIKVPIKYNLNKD